MDTRNHLGPAKAFSGRPGVPIRSLTLVVLLVIGGARLAVGQISIGPRAAYSLDAFSKDGTEEGAFTLGGEARFHLQGLPLELNPGAEFYLNGIDNTDVYQFDANLLYLIDYHNTAFTPYVGTGLGITRVSSQPYQGLVGKVLGNDSDKTDVGVNVLGGATFGFGTVRPFVQARMTFGNHLAFLNRDGHGGSGYALMGGFLIRLGS